MLNAANYTPVAGDVISYFGEQWPVSSIETILGEERAVCSQAWTAGGATLTPSFLLDSIALISSASGAAFFTTAAGGGNTGTGAINGGAITNGNEWIADTYTITFTSTTAYALKNSEGATIATGSYANPTTITFLGVEVTVSGAPAANDTFTITAV